MINEINFIYFIVIGIFLVIGIYVLFRKESPSYELDYRDKPSFYNNEKYIETGDKIIDIFSKIKGVAEIIVGIVLIGVMFFFFIQPMFTNDPNVTFKIGNEVVTKETFYSNIPSVIVPLVFLLFGIVSIIHGIKMLKENK